MKYFFLSFFFFITFAVSLDSYALPGYENYDSQSKASSACGLKSSAINGHACVAVGCTAGPNCKYFYTHVGPYSNNATFYKFLAFTGNCASTNQVPHPDTGKCVAESEIVKQCSITVDTPDCLCTDGLPRDTGQYTSCDRPNLKFCASLGTHIPTSQFCSLLPPSENNCPSDTDFIDGACVHKCGANGIWNGFTKQCESTDKSCPSNHTRSDAGNCIPNTCPPNYKNVNKTCVIDTDPKVSVDENIVTNSDGTKTKTTTTTTVTNNADGTSTTVTNTTTTNYNADGSVASVDSKSEESKSDIPKEEDVKNEVSGSGDCVSPPVCSGDPIACAQTHLLWKISCSTPDQKVENESDCSKNFVCEGGVLECAQLRSSRLQMCSSSTDALGALVNSSLPSNLNDVSKVDSNGLLESAKGESFDLVDKLGITAIFETQGAAGACPPPYTFTVFGSQQTFDYELFICPTVRKINPLVVFAAMIFCSLLIYRAIEGL